MMVSPLIIHPREREKEKCVSVQVITPALYTRVLGPEQESVCLMQQSDSQDSGSKDPDDRAAPVSKRGGEMTAEDHMHTAGTHLLLATVEKVLASSNN